MEAQANKVAALVPVERDDGLVMHCSPAEAQRRVQELQAFVKANMQNGVDYGVIPGTPKPSLWQPGAQKLCELYGIAHDFVDIETIQDWDKGFFVYRKRCVLTMRRNGLFAGAGIGSCNSREDRYAWRWVYENQIPRGVDKAALKTKEFGSKNPVTKYRLPNEDIYSLVNTIEKMSCKRALVHAVIGVTRSAGIFTQDAEDLPEEAFGQVEDARPWEQRDEDAKRVILDMVPPSSAQTSAPAAPKETTAQIADRLIAAYGALTAASAPDAWMAIGNEAAKLPKGGDRNRVMAAYEDAKARVVSEKASAKKDAAPAGDVEDGPCDHVDDDGVCCDNQGIKTKAGIRCRKHEVK